MVAVDFVLTATHTPCLKVSVNECADPVPLVRVCMCVYVLLPPGLYTLTGLKYLTVYASAVP